MSGGSRWKRALLSGWPGALLCYAALTAWLFRDLLGRLTKAVPAGADQLLYLWNLWWIHRALLVEHGSPYTTHMLFYPEGGSLLFHTLGLSALLPFAPLASAGTGGVVLGHNLAVLVSFPATALATWALARDRAGTPLGSLLAGLVYAFSAYRLAMLGWTDLLSAQYLVLYVLFLLRALDGRRGAVAWAGAMLALVAYNSLTHLAFAALLSAGLCVGGRLLRRRTWMALAGIGAFAGVLALPLAWSAWRALSAGVVWMAPEPGASWIASTNPIDFVLPRHTASPLVGAWSGLLPERLGDHREAAAWALRVAGVAPLFVSASLGYTLLGGVLLALLPGGDPRRWRWLALGAVALVLSLGPYLQLGAGPPPAGALPPAWSRIGGEPAHDVMLPYALLERLPGFRMSKAPYRFAMPGLLCLAIAAAFGVGRFASGRVGERPGRRALRIAALASLAAAALLEYAGAAPTAHPMPVSPFAQRLAADPGDFSVFTYPPARDLLGSEQEMWEQVTHGKRLLAGFVARIPGGPRRSPVLGKILTGPDPTRAGAEQQLEDLDRLSRETPLRLKYLIVLPERWKGSPRVLRRFLRLASQRYPRVFRSRDPAPLLLRGTGERSVFYVGEAALLREMQELRGELGRLRADGCDAADGEGAAAPVRLARGWRAFWTSTTADERARGDLLRLGEEIDAALARCRDGDADPRPDAADPGSKAA